MYAQSHRTICILAQLFKNASVSSSLTWAQGRISLLASFPAAVGTLDTRVPAAAAPPVTTCALLPRHTSARDASGCACRRQSTPLLPRSFYRRNPHPDTSDASSFDRMRCIECFTFAQNAHQNVSLQCICLRQCSPPHPEHPCGCNEFCQSAGVNSQNSRYYQKPQRQPTQMPPSSPPALQQGMPRLPTCLAGNLGHSCLGQIAWPTVFTTSFSRTAKYSPQVSGED